MIPFPDKKYKTIYADPPWAEHGGGKIKRGADRHYPLMKTKDIIALPVKELAEENAHLYLWVTNNFLEDGLRVMEAWGFDYKTMITWAKGMMPIDLYCKRILKKEQIDKKDFIDLYNYGYTSQEIGKLANISDWTVRDSLKKDGFVMKSRGKRLNNSELTDYQKEIIDGELLGDGHVSFRGEYKNAFMSWNFKRLDHILLIYDELCDLNPEYSTRTDIEGEGYRIWTQCNEYLTQQHNRWYKDYIKIVPRDIVLTPTVCFHWYIGDGCLTNNAITLCSMGFTYEENIFLSEKLNELGFQTSIHKKQYPSGEKYGIYIKKSSTQDFLDYIGLPLQVPAYAYKWGLTEDEIQKDIIANLNNPSLGQYHRGQTEHCLFGVKGNLPYKLIDGKRQQGNTLIIAPRTIHSRKPIEMRKMIETVSYPAYIELFARESFKNWDHWGNEML